MALFKVLLFTLAIHLFIYSCAAQCTYTASDGSTYDLSSLTKNTPGTYYYYFDGTTNYTFNICGEVLGAIMGAAPLCLTGSAICQGEHGSYVSSGQASNTSFQDSPIAPNQGLTILYGSGTPCRVAIRETRMRMICAPGVSGLEVKNVTQPSTCSYLVQIESSVACPTGGATTAATSDATATTDTTATTAATATTGDVTTTGDTTVTTGDATITTSDVTTTTTTTSDVTTTTTTTTTATSTTATSASASTSGTATTGAHSTAPSTSTTHDSSDNPVHRTPVGKWLIGLVVGLGVFVIIVSVLLVREFVRRRRAQEDSQMERLRLTGSTYEDVKKRYLK